VPQPTGHEHALSRDEEKVFGANVKKDLDVPKTIDAVKGMVPTSPTTRAWVGGAGSVNQIASEIAKAGFLYIFLSCIL